MVWSSVPYGLLCFEAAPSARYSHKQQLLPSQSGVTLRGSLEVRTVPTGYTAEQSPKESFLGCPPAMRQH